jgi:hypothetical protein
MSHRLVLLLGLLACTGKDTDVDPVDTSDSTDTDDTVDTVDDPPVDDDDDGATSDVDCDDADPERSPDFDEVCGDGVDNDCDEAVDGDDDACQLVHCGNLDASVTWTADLRHVVTCDVEVHAESSPVLTLADGAEVVVAEGASIRVGALGPASLRVEGGVLGVRMSSGNASPTPGHWGGLEIAAQAVDVDIAGLEVRDATVGITVGADAVLTDVDVHDCAEDGIRVDDGLFALTASAVHDNGRDGLHMTGGAFDELLLDVTAAGNGRHPVTLTPTGPSWLDATTALTGNDDDRIGIVGTRVEGATAWPLQTLPFRVYGTIEVGSDLGAVFAIFAGNDVVFDGGVDVGLDALGTFVADGVTMSAEPGGTWAGIRIGALAEDTDIIESTIRDAGVGREACVEVLGGSPRLDGLTVRDCDGHGVWVADGASPEISDLFASGATLDGLYVSDDAVLATAMSGAELTANGRRPASLPPSAVERLQASTFSGNADDRIEIRAGTLDESALWRTQDVPYLLSGDVVVQGPGTPVLTIDDDIDFEVADGVALSAGLTLPGRLFVDAEATGSRIAGTAPGAWGGIVLGALADNSEILRMEVTGAGIVSEGDDVNINRSLVVDAPGWGITVAAGSATINRTEVRGAGLGGVLVQGSLRSGSSPSFFSNTLTGNDGPPVQLPAGSVVDLDLGTYTGNAVDEILVEGGSAVDDGSWRDLPVPYRVRDLVVVDGATLFIDAGVTAQFEPAGGLSVRSGSLLVSGAETNPIVFEGDADWYGVHLGEQCTLATFAHVTVTRGGSNGNGALWFEGCDGSVSRSTIQDSPSWGVYRGPGVTLDLTEVSYANNALGDLF